jgi:pimeloyl-ACP methyl ester carboxylesterase
MAETAKTELYFYNPRENSEEASSKRQTSSPLFIFLPGMDGTGRLLHVQLAGLERWFDIRCLVVPPGNRSTWDGLVQAVVELIRVEMEQSERPSIYLCGESFGGCLALKVAAWLSHSDRARWASSLRLVLVNPASSFAKRPWLQWASQFTRFLSDLLYPVACMTFLPFLANLNRLTERDRQSLLQAMQSVTLEGSLWRLNLLQEFNISDRNLRQIQFPTLIVAGQGDRVLPSVAEADYLSQHLPDAKKHILPQSGHACLLEQDVYLDEILKAKQFLPPVPIPKLNRQG